MLMSGSSIAASQNMYVKVYNGVDVLTIMKYTKEYETTCLRKGEEIYYRGCVR